MLTARPKSTTKSNTLQCLVGNLTFLQVKAKNYHWNVTGPSFTGYHTSFDNLFKKAVCWTDDVAERIRQLEQPVDATVSNYCESMWFDEGDCSLDSAGMAADMVKTLDCISGCILDMIKDESNPITSSVLESVGLDVNQQAYLIRSSL